MKKPDIFCVIDAHFRKAYYGLTMNTTDLKQIRTILKEELKPIEKTLTEHGEILKQHGKMLRQHGEILKQHGKILNQHSKELKSLKRDQGTMLNMLDGEQMHQRRRIKRIEDHLDLPAFA